MPRTLARHFSEGKVCDYPAETVLSAVNAYDYGYNSISIPVQIGFKQMFEINIDAFIYMSQHRTETALQSFLSDPNGYMSEVGIKLITPLDDITPKIMVAMLEDEMFDALKSETSREICYLTYRTHLDNTQTNPWGDRHPERYPAKFMKRCRYLFMDYRTENLIERLEAASLPSSILSRLYHIVEFFTEKEQQC